MNPLRRELELRRRMFEHSPAWEPQPTNTPQVLAFLSEAEEIGYGGAKGGGKGLALDTPIPTPNGWTTMGDLKVGDIVFDDQGCPCFVYAVSEINHRPCYRITFSDGATIVADDVHRWVTFDLEERLSLAKRTDEYRAKRRANRPSRATGKRSAAFTQAVSAGNAAKAQMLIKPPPQGKIRNTKQISNTAFDHRGRSNHAILMAGALKLPDIDLPIPPYTLGAWLGDGHSNINKITGIDPQIFERVAQDGYEVRYSEKCGISPTIIGLKEQLRAVGLIKNKHIPSIYLRASESQRLELLRGLMDTDGTCAKDGGCDFDNINERIIDGVMELATSLGLRPTKTEGIAKLNGRHISKKWRVKFTTSLRVFNLDRKAERQHKKEGMRTKFRNIHSCELVESVPTKCISVSSPSHMYLAGRQMIPTHNSMLGTGLASMKHHYTNCFRKNYEEHSAMLEIIKADFPPLLASNPPVYRPKTPRKRKVKARTIRFCHLENGDKDLRKYQGKAVDFLWIDEAVHFTRRQVELLAADIRPLRPAELAADGIKCQMLLTFNPPLDTVGLWVIDFFAPWVDESHPMYPQPYGKILWCCKIDEKDYFLESSEPLTHHPETGKPLDYTVYLKSRTFFRANLFDNEAYRHDKSYLARLQSMGEIERRALLEGEMSASLVDQAGQIIRRKPWKEAEKRGMNTPQPTTPPLVVSIDVAKGGLAHFVCMPFWKGGYAGMPHATEGQNVSSIAEQVAFVEEYFGTLHTTPLETALIVDVGGGFGSGFCEKWREKYPESQVVEFNGGSAAGVNNIYGGGGEDAEMGEISGMPFMSGNMGFENKIGAAWFRAGEMLEHPLFSISVPRHNRLSREAQARVIKERSSSKIVIENKEQFSARLGHSPDYADAWVMGLWYLSVELAVREKWA